MSDVFCTTIGESFLATIISVGNTLCVRPYPKWSGENLCGVLAEGKFAAGQVVHMYYRDGRWQVKQAVPLPKPKIEFEPSTNKGITPPSYNPLGANTAATTYKGICGTCGKNISY